LNALEHIHKCGLFKEVTAEVKIIIILKFHKTNKKNQTHKMKQLCAVDILKKNWAAVPNVSTR